MSETQRMSKAEILGLIGFICSLVAIGIGAEFSIAGLILCNMCLNEQPDYSLAKTGKVISIIGIVVSAVILLVFISRLAAWY